MINEDTVHAFGERLRANAERAGVADPVGPLRSARRALTDGGSMVILELSIGDSLEANTHPVGLPHRRLTELTREAGFSHVRRPVDSPPAHVLYEVTP